MRLFLESPFQQPPPSRHALPKGVFVCLWCAFLLYNRKSLITFSLQLCTVNETERQATHTCKQASERARRRDSKEDKICARHTYTHTHPANTHTHSEIFLRGNATLPLESPSSSFARKHFTLCQAISYFFFGLFSISAPLLLRSPLHTHTHTAWLVKFVDLRVCSVSLVYLFLAGLLAPALTSSHWSGESSPKSKERRA